jgi:nucleoside 2-deoxyribosyltransferase
MKVYIAAPLFNDMERERNRVLRDALQEAGFDTYLPQEDGGIAYDDIASGADVASTRKRIFDRDIEEVKGCDLLVFALDGRVQDEGACVELGYAHALGKPCFGYRTDTRSFDSYGPSLMIEGCLRGIASSLPELTEMLRAFNTQSQ